MDADETQRAIHGLLQRIVLIPEEYKPHDMICRIMDIVDDAREILEEMEDKP